MDPITEAWRDLRGLLISLIGKVTIDFAIERWSRIRIQRSEADIIDAGRNRQPAYNIPPWSNLNREERRQRLIDLPELHTCDCAVNDITVADEVTDTNSKRILRNISCLSERPWLARDYIREYNADAGIGREHR